MPSEALTDRERQIVEHLERAQGLGVTLKEYAEAYELDVRDLYNGKSQLVKKGLLAGRAPCCDGKNGFVAVRVVPSSLTTTAWRFSHPSGWTLKCSMLPEVAWLRALLSTEPDAAT
jgi:hypothetical protein